MATQDLNYLCTRDGKVAGPFTSTQLVEMRRSGAILEYYWVWEAGYPQWMPAVAPPPPPAPDQAKLTDAPEAKTAELHATQAPQPEVQEEKPARSYARFDSRSEMTATSTSTSTSTDMTSEHYFPTPSFGLEDEEEDETMKAVPDRPARHGRKRPQSTETTQEVRRLLVVAHDRRNVINGSLRHPSPSGALFLGPAPRSRSSGPFVRGNRIWINLFDAVSGKSENVEVQVTSTIRRGDTWEYRVRWERMPEILGEAA